MRRSSRRAARTSKPLVDRALDFGAPDGARRIERIFDEGLERLPLPGWPDRPLCVDRDFGRPLVEYGALLEEGMR